MEIRVLGQKLFALHDSQLNGFITWTEKEVNAILLFTSGEKAEEYWQKVYPERPLQVYTIHKSRMEVFVASMLNSQVTYAIIDVPWQHADWTQEHEDETVRDYCIVDLNLVRAKFTS